MKSYVAYIRVSTARQGQFGSSLQEQRDAIVAFATRHGLQISDWYEDRETAAKKGRTQFVRMMVALEKGQAGGVILHKIDRGARNLWDWARLQDLIDAGIEVHFAHDNLDLTSRGGRLAADIQAVVAADYVRNLREEVRKGMRGRLKQGIYPLKAPVGYLDQGKAKAKTIDPVKGPIVRQAFELYAKNRYSYRSLIAELYRRGLHTLSGKPLSLHGVTSMLRNPFYIGIIRMKRSGEVFQGIHEPLIDARLFQRVQEIIDGRENVPIRRFDFAYRRLLKCGTCGYALIGETQKGVVYYRCHTAECATTGVREDAVFASLGRALTCFAALNCDYSEIRPYVERNQQSLEDRRTETLKGLELRLSALKAREKRLTDAYLDAVLDKDTFNNRKAGLLTEVARVAGDLDDVRHGKVDNVASRVAKFLELIKTAQLGPRSGFATEFRDAVNILTSNRTLVGKKLEIELRSPFSELASTLSVPSGGLDRNATRTLTGSPTQRMCPPAPIVPQHPPLDPRAQAKLLLEHLEQISEQLGPASPRPRKPNPSWFTRKAPPSNDGRDQLAA